MLADCTKLEFITPRTGPPTVPANPAMASEEIRAHAESPRTPPTPEHTMNGPTGVPGPSWTLDMLAEDHPPGLTQGGRQL